MNETNTYRIETTVEDNGIVTVTGLPLHAGDKVEVIVRLHADNAESYPLRGLPVEYSQPFDSVAEDDWSALQ